MHSYNDRVFVLPDESATLAAGAKLAVGLRAGMTIFLEGDLGAGKTTLVRGVLRALGISGAVKSPTYTLVEHYLIGLKPAANADIQPAQMPAEENAVDFYHFDLYRFEDPEEWHAAGFREYFHSGSIAMIEWPSKAQGILPLPDIIIKLAPESRLIPESISDAAGAIAGRSMHLSAMTELGQLCVASC